MEIDERNDGILVKKHHLVWGLEIACRAANIQLFEYHNLPRIVLVNFTCFPESLICFESTAWSLRLVQLS